MATKQDLSITAAILTCSHLIWLARLTPLPTTRLAFLLLAKFWQEKSLPWTTSGIKMSWQSLMTYLASVAAQNAEVSWCVPRSISDRLSRIYQMLQLPTLAMAKGHLVQMLKILTCQKFLAPTLNPLSSINRTNKACKLKILISSKYHKNSFQSLMLLHHHLSLSCSRKLLS